MYMYTPKMSRCFVLMLSLSDKAHAANVYGIAIHLVSDETVWECGRLVFSGGKK